MEKGSEKRKREVKKGKGKKKRKRKLKEKKRKNKEEKDAYPWLQSRLTMLRWFRLAAQWSAVHPLMSC